MYRLGAQGRALQKQLASQTYPASVSSLVPQRLSQSKEHQEVQLLLSILNSRDDSHTAELLLSYAVHYFPRLKNEHDVQSLTIALLSNDRLFNRLNFDECYLVIEGIKAMFDHKIRVSQPSLPLTKFYHGFLTAVYDHPAEDWKKMLVLTGVLLSKPTFQDHAVPETRGYFEQCYERSIQLNHELITRCLRNSPVNGFEINSLVSIALACSLISFTGAQRRRLPHETIMIQVIDLVFVSPLGLANISPIDDMLKRPVVKHLSRLAFLVENCFVNGVKYPVMDGALTVMLDFAFTLHQKLPIEGQAQTWDLLKSILFGVVIMLQGFASFSLNLYNGLKTDEYSILSTKAIKILFFLNFILEKIGTGGFQAYNFVLLTTIDGLFQYSNRAAEQLGTYMISHCSLNNIPSSHYESSKALFTINYFEHFTKSCSHSYHDSTIAPFINHFIKMPLQSQSQSTTYRSLIEAAHSVILATFTPRNAAIIATMATSYLHTVLSQYPTCLSSQQLNIAVESITRAVAPPSEAYYLNRDNLREVLHTLYITIINSSCSEPLNEQGKGPKTVRQGLICALIGTLTYIPVEILENWLNNCWELCVGDKYLELQLWKQISEGLDMQRGSIGVRWWYAKAAGDRQKL